MIPYCRGPHELSVRPCAQALNAPSVNMLLDVFYTLLQASSIFSAKTLLLLDALAAFLSLGKDTGAP
ncbi:unnamed protein product [Staurois parvus]|uniref:Uncharacterized protein n=1 Tax=Staurois parvus TaxID=386267 RepID=A0ABN9CMG9_9NEOB|nr:unnamed protein product [Staurois parvus]